MRQLSWNTNPLFDSFSAFKASRNIVNKGLKTSLDILQNDVLAGKLSIHQGGLRDEALQDGRMDGKRREIHL